MVHRLLKNDRKLYEFLERVGEEITADNGYTYFMDDKLYFYSVSPKGAVKTINRKYFLRIFHEHNKELYKRWQEYRDTTPDSWKGVSLHDI